MSESQRENVMLFLNITMDVRHGTSHVAIADASGLAFSLTTTINLFFGSRVMVPETGVIMNNEMNGIRHPFPYLNLHLKPVQISLFLVSVTNSATSLLPQTISAQVNDRSLRSPL